MAEIRVISGDAVLIRDDGNKIRLPGLSVVRDRSSGEYMELTDWDRIDLEGGFTVYKDGSQSPMTIEPEGTSERCWLFCMAYPEMQRWLPMSDLNEKREEFNLPEVNDSIDGRS